MENLRDEFALQQQYSRPVWIKITGSSGVRYSWSQVDETDVAAFDTANLDANYALSGTTTATGWPAYEVNGSTTVPTNTKVLAYPSVAGDSWVFEYNTASGSGITVAEVDGAPSYASTTTLRFDQADGFVLTQPGANIARVDQTPASGSTVGYVTLADQTLGTGTKTVQILGVTVGAVGAGYFAPVDTGGGCGFFQADPGGEGVSTDADSQVWAGQFVANTGIQSPFFDVAAGGTGYLVNSTTVIDGSGFFRPVSSADAGAPNNSIYYSTTAGKLVYKDSGGTVNNLY